ncbi:hypothetical protein [Burkholderia sp. NRF60-BP8]|uniref:hypothetical protein n=1 Tax=Burkholderia sp. NRF60-BP8 TaxID=1637853 RepID=UPI00075416AA|nr:hypothetical protein [Burkholderia sp. NRF60-BP8]AOI76090.1 hypothetical protein WS54_07265 [Burkholderia sp. NRF60-BP8]KVA07102.1 hypothetical protein WS54_23340 [Burkholderia sp. NRF60-BP8]
MKEPILSREEVKALYSKHFANPYDLLPLWAEAFAAAIESALLEKLCGEPVAYTTQANFEMMKKHNTGVMYRDALDGDIPLYALNRSKA